jgi:bis(5'-nucleosidyl)-tetraphosphatase
LEEDNSEWRMVNSPLAPHPYLRYKPVMSRNQRSAGFVIFRRTASGETEFLLLDYGRHWDFTKGHVEKGEDDLTAAIRELKEETFLEDPVSVPGFQHEIRYYFRDRKQQLVHKTVIYFLAEVGQGKIHLSDEHVGYAYLPFEEALQRLTYASSREILRVAQAHLKNIATDAVS